MPPPAMKKQKTGLSQKSSHRSTQSKQSSKRSNRSCLSKPKPKIEKVVRLNERKVEEPVIGVTVTVANIDGERSHIASNNLSSIEKSYGAQEAADLSVYSKAKSKSSLRSSKYSRRTSMNKTRNKEHE